MGGKRRTREGINLSLHASALECIGDLRKPFIIFLMLRAKIHKNLNFEI